MSERKPATISCKCVECGMSFYEKGYAVGVMPSMRPVKKWQRGDPLTTWADWVMHIQTHCPDCRIVVPPPDCVNDLRAQLSEFRHANSQDFELESDEYTRLFNERLK